jgi:hypothetical protein
MKRLSVQKFSGNEVYNTIFKTLRGLLGCAGQTHSTKRNEASCVFLF